MLYTQLIICKYNENSVHERKFINYYKIAPLILFGWEMFRAALTAYPTLFHKREGLLQACGFFTIISYFV